MHEVVKIIAKDFIILPPILLAYVWFKLPRDTKKQAVILGIIAAILTGLFAVIGSKLFNDPRPFIAGHFTPYFPHGNDNGFPSDHTLAAGLIAAITYVYNKRLGAVAAVLAVAIGSARVIAGVHHAIDIIGALVFAGAATAIAEYIVKRAASKQRT